MPKVILDQPQVVAAVGQREAAGMSKHVRMHGRQPGTSGRLGQQIVHRLTRERLPPFGDEQPGQRIGAAGQVALDRAEFIAGDGMLHIQPTLQTPDPGPWGAMERNPELWITFLMSSSS
jgi:hypothetical protein